MNKRNLTLTAASVTIAAALASAAIVVVAQSGSIDDPANARCNTADATFGSTHDLGDHREVVVHFRCMDVVLSGTLTLPPGSGPHPAAVWVHGSGEAVRLTYGAPVVKALVRSGVAVLAYDKRGVGESEGRCCPGDEGHFNLTAADVDAAVEAIRSRSDIDRDRVGLIGASQAGWVVPLAVSRARHPVAFTALVDAPVVSQGEERLYSRMTDDGAGATDSDAAMISKIEEQGPSGFDPRPLLGAMTSPGLWLYGARDLSQPTTADLRVLAGLRAAGQEFKAVVFPDADHGLLDVPPSDPRAVPTLVRWIHRTVHSSASVTR